MLAENAAEEAAAAAALGVKRVGTVDDLQCLDEDLENAGDRAARRVYAQKVLHGVLGKERRGGGGEAVDDLQRRGSGERRHLCGKASCSSLSTGKGGG